MVLRVRSVVPRLVARPLAPISQLYRPEWNSRLPASATALGAMDRAFSSSSSFVSGGAPRAVESDGIVAAPARARPNVSGGLLSLPDLIVLGRESPVASTAGCGSVAPVHGASPFDLGHAHPVATDRAIVSDKGLTGTRSQRGSGGPTNTPRDMMRRSGVSARPRRRYARAIRPPPAPAASRWANAETTELDTTEADMTKMQMLMTEMRQELKELRPRREQIAETAPSAAMPEALPAPSRVAQRAGPTASTR